MAKIRISGVEYDLRLNMWAMEQLEKKYGDMSVAMARFKQERKISQVKEMFVILANAGRIHAGEKPDVAPGILDKANLKDLDLISQCLSEAMDEAMHAETVGGNEADDEVADGYAAEYEQREKNA